MKARAVQRGFTLSEALVAIAVTAALVAAIAPALFGASRLSARIDQDRERLEALGADAGLLRMLAASSLRPPPELDESFGLRGSRTELSFIGDPPDTLGPVRLRAAVAEDGIEINVERLYDAPVQSATVFEGWSEVSFRYWGKIDARTDAAWSDEWTSPRPPRLWMIEGRVDGAVRRIYLLMGAEEPLACRFDPVIRTCRGAV